MPREASSSRIYRWCRRGAPPAQPLPKALRLAPRLVTPANAWERVPRATPESCRLSVRPRRRSAATCATYSTCSQRASRTAAAATTPSTQSPLARTPCSPSTSTRRRSRAAPRRAVARATDGSRSSISPAPRMCASSTLTSTLSRGAPRTPKEANANTPPHPGQVRATQSQGAGLKEAGAINRSLFALGQATRPRLHPAPPHLPPPG